MKRTLLLAATIALAFGTSLAHANANPNPVVTTKVTPPAARVAQEETAKEFVQKGFEKLCREQANSFEGAISSKTTTARSSASRASATFFCGIIKKNEPLLAHMDEFLAVVTYSKITLADARSAAMDIRTEVLPSDTSAMASAIAVYRFLHEELKNDKDEAWEIIKVDVPNTRDTSLSIFFFLKQEEVDSKKMWKIHYIYGTGKPIT